MIIKECGSKYEKRVANFIRGRRLKAGEKSRGIYGVVATDKDLVLRVPLRQELAELYTQDESRHVEEIFLSFEKKVKNYV